MHKLLAICIILFCLQKIALSFQIYKLNSKAVNDVPSLKEIIQRERNKEIQYVMNKAARAQERRRPKPIGKALLVKRIIPHGYVGSDYEYDPKLNTVFKPLVRIHITKPIAEHEKVILKDLEAIEKGRRKERKGQFWREKYRFRVGQNRFRKGEKQFRKGKDRFRKGNERFREGKDGFRKGKGRYGDAVIVLVKKDPRNPHDLLRQIQNYIQNERRPKQYKKRFRSILGRLKHDDDDKFLRTFLLEKSGEIKDPLAPGKIPEFLIPEKPDQVEEPEKVMYQNYPFWNYWTYKKNILQDECKGNLVKMGNMCVSVTGHRKYLEPIKNSITHINPRRKSIKTVNPWKLLKSLKPLKLVSLKKKLPKKKKIVAASPRKYRKFQYKK